MWSADGSGVGSAARRTDKNYCPHLQSATDKPGNPGGHQDNALFTERVLRLLGKFNSG